MNRPNPSSASDARRVVRVVCRLLPAATWLVLACGLAGCRSRPVSPPQPALIAQANETAQIAARQAQHGRWPDAAARWEQAADLYALLNQRDQEAVARHNLAQALKQLGSAQAARFQLEQAAGLNQTLGLQNEWWRNQVALLQLAASQGDHATLAARFPELLGQSSQIAEPNTRALFWNEAGLWHLQNGELTEADAAFAKAELDFARARNTAGWATTLGNRALTLEKQEQFQAARSQWRAAQAKFEALGDPMGIATALAGQGRTLLRERIDLAQAEDLLRRAAGNFERLQASAALTSTRGWLREVLRLQGKTEDSQASKPGSAER